MTWFFGIVVVLALGAIALVASGHGTPMVDEYDDRRDALVPTGELSATDLRRVRFSLGFRGYRMSEVDALLRRLADQLEGDRVAEVAAPLDVPVESRGTLDAPGSLPVRRADDVPPE